MSDLPPYKQNIKDQLEILLGHGVKGPFVIVPAVVNKRCFVPCHKGWCNCFPTIEGRFCLVTEEYKKSAMEDANREIDHLNRVLKEIS